MSNKQGSIAGFFTRSSPKTKVPKKEPKSEVIDLTESTEADRPPTSPRKRRKLSSDQSSPAPHVEALSKGDSAPKADRLTIDPSEPFNYPPANHGSYHLPPDPNYNHPFTITPPPNELLTALAFSQSPKPILRPNLNLDLLYFNQFISPPGSRALYDYLLEALPWYRVKYTVRGININTPRWTTVFGKDASTADWKGYPVKPRAIPEILLRLMEIGQSLSTTFLHRYSFVFEGFLCIRGSD
jgi:hypothetical protein